VQVKHLLHAVEVQGQPEYVTFSWAKVEVFWEWPALFIFGPINRGYSMARRHHRLLLEPLRMEARLCCLQGYSGDTATLLLAGLSALCCCLLPATMHVDDE
jgi:hypothetical protein